MGGGFVKSGHMRTHGGGGQWQNAVVLKIQIFTKIFKVNLVYCVIKDNIRFNNNRFLNRLLLVITVIDLMSIVHVDKI